jgi:hypothetical protein
VKFSEFVNVFVAALYNETQLTGRTSFQIKDILKAYGLSLNPTWHDALFKDYTFSTHVDVSRRHLGPTEDQHVSLSPDGLRWVEDELGENVAAFLEQHGAFHESQRLPKEVTEITRGRVLTGPRGSMDNVEGREGDILLEYEHDESPGVAPIRVRDEVQAELVPASDRLVPLDHNSAPYRQVKEGLAELREELRTANDLECAPEERERLLASLSAAQDLWEAAQLKIIQIKVGIIITIQDTLDLLTKVGKAIGKSVLIDLVKSIVKHKTGIDL